MLGQAEYFAKNLVTRQLIRHEGRGKFKNVAQSLINSMLLVRNSFNKKRLTTKSSDDRQWHKIAPGCILNESTVKQFHSIMLFVINIIE
jgi:hypothetical protein